MSGQARHAALAWSRLRLAAIALACAALSAAAAETPIALQERGAGIYNVGDNGAGQPILARIGSADVLLPGATLPCAGCHGPEGLGRPEGGVEPVPLTWDHLTKPYGHRHANGRDHPAFTAATLKRAITRGIDPAGNRLDPAMPRFEMAEEDLDALIAHLKELGSGDAPGVAATTITLGMVVAGEGPLAVAGDAAAALAQAYIGDLNAQAGVYGRTLVLKVERIPGDPAAAVAALERLIEEPVFALLAAVPPGLQEAVAERAEAASVPTFHLWPPAAQTSPEGQHYSFYLLAGLRQEIEALVGFAEESLVPERPRAAILISPQHQDGPAVEAVASRWTEAAKVALPTAMKDARRLAGTLRDDGTEVLFLLMRGPGVAMLLAAAAEIGWSPAVLAPGSLAGEAVRALPTGFEGKVFLAYPTTPADRDPDQLARMASLRPDAGPGGTHALSEATAYGAMSLLVEAMRRASRELTRERLIAAVERLHRFHTGVLPPLSYGPNRRIGAAQLHILQAR